MTVPSEPTAVPTFLWLDLTRRCQLSCRHCYNASGPDGGHGAMTRQDWFGVLDQAVAAGVGMIQLIGGEPTLHPDFAALLDRALTIGLRVEVFSNLVQVRDEWWTLFQRPGVSLATSYYSDDAAEHNEITGRDSHRKTRANIARALGLGIHLRTGVIATTPVQRVPQALADLAELGVTRMKTDRLRHFGRGGQGHDRRDPAELCGGCGQGVAAIGPDGTVTPCVMADWMAVGNVRESPLGSILAGPEMAAAVDAIPRRNPCGPTHRAYVPTTASEDRPAMDLCAPQACNPACQPMAGCFPRCAPTCSP